MENIYIISYDISDTRIRNQVSKVLEGHGTRIQYSVFECDLDEKRFASLYERLLKLTLDTDTDSICIYRLCKKCAGEAVTIGRISERKIRKEDYAVIV